MSKYTTELRYLIESKFDIGLKDYPIYKEEYRSNLNDKIIEHFYFREIGVEVPQLFKKFLNRKMSEIMPYYNQLYKSADIEFNPLWNVELHETFSHSVKNTGLATTENNSETTNEVTNILTESNESTLSNTETTQNNSTNTLSLTENNTNNSENLKVLSDTPQSTLSDEDIKAHVYATNTEHNKDSNTNNQSSTKTEVIDNDVNNTLSSTSSVDITKNDKINGTNSQNETGKINQSNEQIETYTKLTEGSSAGLPYSNAIKQWRSIMINIDMQIIEELEPLFIQLW